jgi:antitoxin component of MazEF toxin-antitoxin module
MRWGKASLGLTLPADLIYDLGWKEKQKVPSLAGISE